jgi:hypothetical protein
MSINKENRSYRKGVVLGLTMAEILILIVFILLLAFATLLKNEEDKIKLFEANRESLNKILELINQPDNDISKELVRVYEKMPEILSDIKKEDLKNEPMEPVEDVIRRAIKKLKIEKDLKSLDKELSIEENLIQALQDKENLQSKLDNVEGQNKNLIRQCKGIGLPPCWADKNGSPEYIFNLDLQDDGIVIHNNKLSHRAQEQSKLNISRVQYKVALRIGAFSSQTFPLLKYGQENECRFFVRILDRTGEDKKELYKSLRQAVEGNFYILKRN